MNERIYLTVLREEGTPLVLMTAGIRPEEKAGFPYAVTFALPYEAAHAGFPGGGDLKRLNKLEDQLVRALPEAIHAGHVTGAGRMLVVFYARGPMGGPITVKTGLLSKAAFTPECRHDPDWAVFEEHLRLRPHEKVQARYQQLFDTLAEHGDDPSLPRMVDFTALFPSAATREAFAAEAAAKGCQVTPLEGPDFGLEFSHESTLEIRAFTALHDELEALCEKFGGTLDGWACPLTQA